MAVGKLLIEYLYICKPILWITNFLKGNMFSSKNNGMVCSVYVENVMKRIIFFCSLIMGSKYESQAFPQISMQ